MAPEFMPFFLVIGLALVLGGLVLVAIWPSIPRRLLEEIFPLILGHIRFLAIVALLPTALLLLLVAYHVRQQYFLNEPMASAASGGDISLVQTLLDRGASPNSWGIDFVYPAVVGAAANGHKDIVKLLLDRGARPNSRDIEGKSALQHAREKGNKDIEGLLIKAGARD